MSRLSRLLSSRKLAHFPVGGRRVIAESHLEARSWKQPKDIPIYFSEKQAAKRLGVARITLLRARGTGRIRFFRIGTRVLYSDEQLADFLARCERPSESNQRKAN